MNDLIKIEGNNSDVLSVSLFDILDVIHDGAKYQWKLLWLEATTKSEEKSILDLEKLINDIPEGYLLSWNKLIELSKFIDQSINVLLIGNPEIIGVSRMVSDALLKQNNMFYIELIDASYWEVYTQNEKFASNISKYLI